jgi:tRNA(adenine34) deaminase
MTDDDVMRVALEEARAALAHDDVPVGAVVVHNGKIIAQRHNERELTSDPTAHAEVLALRDASRVLETWHLENCTLYVTLEPCVMGVGAAINSRVARIVFGAPDVKAGATGSLYNVASDPRINHNPAVRHGVLASESSELLRDFFQQRR